MQLVTSDPDNRLPFLRLHVRRPTLRPKRVSGSWEVGFISLFQNNLKDIRSRPDMKHEIPF